MRKVESKYDVSSPEIQSLLLGVYRSGPKSYHGIDSDGKHYVVPIRKQLIGLGMCAKTASRLLKEACVPYAEFVPNEPVDPVEPEPDPAAMVIAALEAAGKERKREEKLAKKAEIEERANSKRYQHIQTNSGKFGIWQADEGRVIALFLTKEEAIGEMARLRAGSSQVGLYYGSKRQPATG